MLYLLILSIIEVNLYSNKSTYLIGEDILVRWEIINKGTKVDYYGITGNIKYSRHFQFLDLTGKQVWRYTIRGTFVSKGNKRERKCKATMHKIESGDTVKSRETNLTGTFGSGRFSERGIASYYVIAGEYIMYIFFYEDKNCSSKIYSDTLRITVKEPHGEERDAWQLYKAYKREDILAKEEDKQIKYALELLQKYPNSVYIESLVRNLGLVFGVYKRPGYEEDREMMRNEARALINYLKRNIEKMERDKEILKDALWCIINGELMLGTPKEQVKSQITKMNVPLNKEIKEFLSINGAER